MKQSDLLNELKELKPQFERMKKLKVAAKEEEYNKHYPHVNLNAILNHFLQELGEFLVEWTSAKLDDKDFIEKIDEELVDLSNMVDFFYTYLHSAPRYMRVNICLNG